jgi:hypothetical protein
MLDVLRDVFGSRVLSNRFPERFDCGRSWPPCSPDMNAWQYFLWVYLNYCVHRTKPPTLQELQVGIVADTEEVKGETLCHSWNRRPRDLILNTFAHECHMHETLHESEFSFIYNVVLYPRKLRRFRSNIPKAEWKSEIDWLIEGLYSTQLSWLLVTFHHIRQVKTKLKLNIKLNLLFTW